MSCSITYRVTQVFLETNYVNGAVLFPPVVQMGMPSLSCPSCGVGTGDREIVAGRLDAVSQMCRSHSLLDLGAVIALTGVRCSEGSDPDGSRV